MDRTLFSTHRAGVPAANALNSERAPAYAFSAEHALAQYAATGCLSTTFYASAAFQLQAALALLDRVSPAFVARTAIWSRKKSFMKDLPALLSAYLTVADPALAEATFERIIDDTKMLRNWVQILRSGAVGRRSLGSMPKRLVQRWLASRTSEQLFRGSIGDRPSLGDVIKLAHPRPKDPERSALYAYLTGRAHDASALPETVQAFEAWKTRRNGEPPAVPFQLLTSLDLDREAWLAIARRASWQETRMSLSTFARHQVFASKRTTALIAAKLRDREAIRRAKVLPYQLMIASRTAGDQVPSSVREALEDALEIALENVPEIGGKVYVCPDVSGSMSSPITGRRKGATTSVRCVDVAALIAAAMMRVNDATVLPFEHRVVDVRVSRRDSVLANARKLASVGGGGTSCSAPLARLNADRAKGALVVLVSDNESWVDARRHGTGLMVEWEAFRARNPEAKLVCIDLTPNRTTQAVDREDVLNVGGFSDAVFEVIAGFVGGARPSHWVDRIQEVAI